MSQTAPDTTAAADLVEWEIAVELDGGGCHILWQQHPDYHDAIVAALAFAAQARGRVLTVEAARDSGSVW